MSSDSARISESQDELVATQRIASAVRQLYDMGPRRPNSGTRQQLRSEVAPSEYRPNFAPTTSIWPVSAACETQTGGTLLTRIPAYDAALSYFISLTSTFTMHLGLWAFRPDSYDRIM
jgi:hypothetical protein